MVNIAQSVIMEMKIPVPPLSEQMGIIAFLMRNSANLDALTETATTTITLLQERRAALISAAVTGKIDVRDTSSSFDAA